MKIDTISRELIKPSSPTPYELRDFKLSLFDQRIPPTYVPLILYYTSDERNHIDQSQISNLLKESLSHVLTKFYPLAGRMKGQIFVDSNDEGAYFVEVQVDANLSDIINGCRETEVLDQFVPYNFLCENIVEQLAIQVSYFNCGGIAIGFCISHRISDGCTLCTFIKAWAEKACGKESNMVCPVFNSASLFPARNSPEYWPMANNPSILPLPKRVLTRRFVFSASAIAALKLKLVNSSSKVQNPTRVEAVTALIWKGCISAAGIKQDRKSMACHPVNLRRKMVPPLPDCSFGNIFQMANAVTSGDQTDLDSLVDKLRAGFEKIDDEYSKTLQGENGAEIVKENFTEIGKLLKQGEVQVLRFASWCAFPVYETADFGWGKPSWVSCASFGNIDSIMLLNSKSAGGVEAWVVLEEKEMEKFEQDLEIQAVTSSSSAVE